MLVQHCTLLTVSSFDFIQPSITTPSLLILSSACSGVLFNGRYPLMALSLACTCSSASGSRAMRPKISLRSNVSTVMPLRSRSFSE